MSRSTPQPAPEKVAAFWDAVAATPDSFVADMMEAGAQGQQTSEFGRVADLLAQIHPDLLLIVGGPTAARPEIVISAGGITEAFPAVLAVADAAPSPVTDRYQVRAFRPRMPDPGALSVRRKGKTTTAADIRWDAQQQRRHPSRCDLTLYIPGWIDALGVESPANRPVAENTFLLLDHLIGEWSVEMQVGAIDWRSAKEATGLPTLLDLPAYLDQIAAQ